MKRYYPPRGADHAFFRRTANKIKSINLYPTVYRGGIRL